MSAALRDHRFRRPSPPGEYRVAEFTAATGLTVRQADYWARSGLLMPSVCAAAGSGSRRVWSSEDVVLARIFVRAAEVTRGDYEPLMLAGLELRELVELHVLPAGVFITKTGAVHLEPVTGTYVDLAGITDDLPPP